MIKNLFARALGRLGYEFRPLWSPTNAFVEQQRLLKDRQNLIIVDAGAHFGESAWQYLTLFPAARIYSFEPFPDSFAKLQTTIANHKNAQAFNVALSDRVGEIEFNSNNYTATNSLLTTSPEAESAWPGGAHDTKQQIRVPTTTLDHFCQEHAIDGIDLLKLDVQGAEPIVLKGAEGLLRRGKVRWIYTELLTVSMYEGQMKPDAFFRMMQDYGFELFNLFNLNTSASGQLRQLDGLFRAVEVSG